MVIIELLLIVIMIVIFSVAFVVILRMRGKVAMKIELHELIPNLRKIL